MHRITQILATAAALTLGLAGPATAHQGEHGTRKPLPSTASAKIEYFGTVPLPEKNHEREGRYVVTVSAGSDQTIYNPGAWTTVEWCPTSVSTKCPGGWFKVGTNDEKVVWDGGKRNGGKRTVTMSAEFAKPGGAHAFKLTVRAKVMQRRAGQEGKLHTATLGPIKTVLRGSDMAIDWHETKG